MPIDPLQIMRERIAEALGGQSAEAFVSERAASFSKNTLRSWIDGKTCPRVRDLLELARLTGRDPFFFLPLKEEPPPYVLVPMSHAEAAAGAGANLDEVEKGEPFPFSRAFIKRLGGEPNSVESLRARDDSMEPTIKDGALLMIDRSQRKPHEFKQKPVKAPKERLKPDYIFVFRQDEHLRLKRLRLLDAKGAIAILSDNITVHQPEFTKLCELDILGRVIWWDNLLRPGAIR